MFYFCCCCCRSFVWLYLFCFFFIIISGLWGLPWAKGRRAMPVPIPPIWAGLGECCPFASAEGPKNPVVPRLRLSRLSKASDECGLGWGELLFFFSLSFLLLLHILCAPLPLPHAEASLWGHFGAFALPQGVGTSTICCSSVCTELFCLGAPSSTGGIFALKVISINKPPSASFVSCLGFGWRWESSAGRKEGQCPMHVKHKVS